MLKCPSDYRQWLQSMFALFGTKWVKLHCGPMWSVATTVTQDGVLVESFLSESRDPLQVIYYDFFKP